jgi:hypothetical protein
MPPCLIKSPYLHCSFLYSIFKETKKKKELEKDMEMEMEMAEELNCK